MKRSTILIRFIVALSLVLPQASVSVVSATVVQVTTGTLVGRVLDQARTPLAGARVRVTNRETGNVRAVITDNAGRYQVAYLPPAKYMVEASHPNYVLIQPTAEPITVQLNRTIETLPDIVMGPRPGAPVQPAPTTPQPVTPTPVTPAPPQPTTVTPTPTPTPAPLDESTGRLTNGGDASRRFNADERMILQLPLAGIRTFDDLAFLFPGVAPPPAVFGVTGPGIGSGIGTAGQFSVNGLRARSNNFTVDGSDNNDEDVGVRRQGFVSLVPQSIESIQDFQIVTSLWDAELGRAMGSQVNAVSRSGGRLVHGSFYDFFNHDAFNARNFFDYTAGAATPLRSLRVLRYQGGQPVNPSFIPVRIGSAAAAGTSDLLQPSPSGGENPFKRNQAGMTLSVPFSKKIFGAAGKEPAQTFFFGSFERQVVRAQQETHFAVPTVEERGFLNFGSTGFLANDSNGEQQRFFPTFLAGDAVYSLFPLPNHPSGPYGRHTFTQVLPANATGTIFSLKFDHNFTMFGPEVTHQFTGRYNFTNDERQVPTVGNAIASGIEPHVGTQNISLFLNSQLTPMLANQLRGSYGRTRLRFDRIRDSQFTSSQALPDNDYLLNARRLANFSNPRDPVNFVDYRLAPAVTTPNTGIVFRPAEDALGPLGQLIVTPYSAIGIDPYLFPQARTNNTFQVADTVTFFKGNHTLKFGADIRRTQLNSFLDRNYRSQIIFGGSLDLTGVFDTRFPDAGIPFPNVSQFGPTPGFVRGTDLAALGIPTGVFQSLAPGTPDSTIGLRFWQHNFFINDNWRIRPGFSIDFGVRYEYNTVPKEVNGRIERTFNLAGIAPVDPSLGIAVSYVDEDGILRTDPPFPNANLVNAFAQTRTALQGVIGGRENIFDADRNNFGPHFSFAWDPWSSSPTQAGKTVIRGGMGIYYDVALGSVVSQSRNVFPTFIPVNLDVNTFNNLFFVFDERFFDQNVGNGNGFVRIINPYYLPMVVMSGGRIQPLNCPGGNVVQGGSIVCPDTLNRIGLQSGAAQAALGFLLNPSGANLPGIRQSGGGLAFTLPDRELRSPYAYHYNLQLEREFFGNFLFNIAYVGTRGFKLTRFRTPNGGVNSPTFPVDPLQIDPSRSLVPAVAFTQQLFPGVTGFRNDSRLGAYTIFDSSADSRYHSLQTSLSKRFQAGYQFTAAYTWSHGIDDVSDVFDMAGAFSLPQNDGNLEGERGSANFDLRHRFALSTVAEFPGLRRFNNSTGASRFWLGGWQLSGIVIAQTGQPYTVNTSFDMNLDGNLTDRLNTTNGLQITDDRRQPIVVTTNNLGSLLPTVFNSQTGAVTPRDGAVGRNTFRSSGVFKVDLTVMKSFRVKEGQDLILRFEAFNLANRSHFAIPVRILEAPSFGQAVSTSLNPRQIQLALKYTF